MKKFFYISGIILNYLFALLLLLSYLSVYVNPGSFPYLALMGLLFPFLLVINVLFLILRIWQFKKLFLISLIAILIGFFRIGDFYAFKHTKVVSTPVNPIKIMSYNVRLFDHYNWSSYDDAGSKIFEIIKKENADVICLQEFYSDEDHNYQDQIIKAQGTKGYVISNKKGAGYSGNAIFSRFPIVNSGFIDIGTTTQKCIFADIIRNRDTIRIYSMHLASVHLSNDDYKFLENIKNNEENDHIESVKGIGSKLVNAYKTRSKEVDAIVPHVTSSPYKTIICGDFNDTPISYAYRQIKGEMKDVFLEEGFGIGNTYAKNFPVFRIDYILHSSEMNTSSYKRINEDYSDHYAITAVLD